MANLDQGYEDSRFEKDVDKNFHCPICMNVLKDPVQCHRNQHYYCTPCIKRHLEQNSQTCPLCQEELTEETLGQPARIVTDFLSSLKINCDYANRGCGESVELEFLQRHVVNCGYSPTKCGNDGCLTIINKQEKERHESQVCDFRMVKCEECGKDVQHKAYKMHNCLMTMRTEVNTIKMNLSDMKTDMKDQLELMKNQMQWNQEEMMKEVRGMKLEIKDQMNNQMQICNQEEMMKEVRGMKLEIKDQMNNLTQQATELKEEMKYVKAVVEGPHQANTRGNIVVAGGFDGKSGLNSVDMFNWAERAWVPLQPMKERRQAPSSFVYKQQMFVAGGYNGQVRLDSMERMNMNQELGQWREFEAKLPFKSTRHSTVVYEDRLIMTGGENGVELSNGLYEIRLTPPYSTKLLSTMPQPISFHGSQLIDDKILIAGGNTTGYVKDSVASVLLYDIANNICKEMPQLPFAMGNMASVSWKGNLICLGGRGKEGKALNTVFIYHVKTGRSEMLPPMKYRRFGCAAVVTGNVIVVMGGYNEEEKHLNYVEYFNLDRYTWEELPPMKENRLYPTAVVKPVI